MMNLKNFKKYKKYSEPDGFLYLICDEGIDWYDARPLFQKDSTKFMYDSKTGIIVSASRDVNDITPMNFCVSEVEYNGDVNNLYGMVFDGVNISPYIETEQERVSRIKNELTHIKRSVIIEMNHLKMTIDCGVATDDEIKQFEKFQSYVVGLSKITDDEILNESFVIPHKPE